MGIYHGLGWAQLGRLCPVQVGWPVLGLKLQAMKKYVTWVGVVLPHPPRRGEWPSWGKSGQAQREPSNPQWARSSAVSARQAGQPLGGGQGKKLRVPFAHLSRRLSPCTGAQEVSLVL